jgi:hypothetical protein
MLSIKHPKKHEKEGKKEEIHMNCNGNFGDEQHIILLFMWEKWCLLKSNLNIVS